ncbi:amino acid racemase [Candidatus Woesebacteria bacterium]|jgi:aspartate racemase|nr:amino acid racemase [Candidatus Woesebacteria bacterium]
MQVAGIIGGLGPETTSKFYLEVNFSCFEKDKTNRPSMLVWNVPLPYQIEEDFILKAQGEDRYIPYLIDAAQRLEKGGADFIVIPCNSVHIFINQIRESVNIPVLSIIEETVSLLKKKNIKEVGILATSSTIRKQLYEDSLKANGIKVIAPNEEDQSLMGEIINNLVHSRQDKEDKDKLQLITKNLVDQGTRTVLLACTDLQLISPIIQNTEIIDTMDILAQTTVREILAK